MTKTKQSILNVLNSILGRVTMKSSAVDRIKYESMVLLQTYYKDAFNDLVCCHIPHFSSEKSYLFEIEICFRDGEQKFVNHKHRSNSFKCLIIYVV